jgi:hypothetical protein
MWLVSRTSRLYSERTISVLQAASPGAEPIHRNNTRMALFSIEKTEQRGEIATFFP